MRSMAPQDYSLNESFDECQRNGAMVAFKNFEEFLNEYETVLELFDQDRSQNGSRHHVNAGTPGSWDESKMLYNRSGLQKEPTNILYIALKVGDNELEITDKLNQFCRGRTHQLSEAMIRRLTFIIRRLEHPLAISPSDPGKSMKRTPFTDTWSLHLPSSSS